jgi:transposase
MTARKPYPSDVSDEEWALVAPYLTLLPEGVAQRKYPLREVFNGLRYVVKTGAPWHWMPKTCRPGRPSTSRRSVGWRQAASTRWPRTFERCCAWPRGERRNPVLPS